MLRQTPSADQCRQMQHEGYLVVRHLVERAQVAQLLEWTAELECALEAPGRHWFYHEDSLTTPNRRLIQRIENFCPYHEGFDHFARRGSLAIWTRALMGGPVLLFKDKINFKMPGGGGFAAHQYQQAGWSAYASIFVTAMLTLDEATLENGCLESAAAGHKGALSMGEQWKPLEVANLNLQPVTTEPGDVVFFDSFVPHASKPNFTAFPRRVLYLTYNLASEGDQRTRYLADKHASFPALDPRGCQQPAASRTDWWRVRRCAHPATARCSVGACGCRHDCRPADGIQDSDPVHGTGAHPAGALRGPGEISVLLAKGLLVASIVAAGLVLALRAGVAAVMERAMLRLGGSLGWPATARIEGLHDMLQACYRAPVRLVLSGAWHLISWILGGLEVWLILHFFGRDIPFGPALIIESLGQASKALGFAIPGAVGVQEGGYVVACGVLGLPPEVGLALSLMKRLREVVWGAPALVVWHRAEARAPAVVVSLNSVPGSDR
jgi:2-aminoethylphosphonate dioxygenase